MYTLKVAADNTQIDLPFDIPSIYIYVYIEINGPIPIGYASRFAYWTHFILAYMCGARAQCMRIMWDMEKEREREKEKERNYDEHGVNRSSWQGRP